VFRRKKDKGDSEEVNEALDNGADEHPSEARTSKASLPGEGPIDVADWDGESRVVDFGSLLIPAFEGMQVRVDMDNDVVVGVSVKIEESTMQLQAFAAPRSEGLWDEVRQEIAEGIRRGQGKAREADGPFGRELRAEVPVAAGASGSRQPVRFIGADGPRWFVRGLISGAGGRDPEQARAVEAVFQKLVVRRGDQAAPPREPLPLAIPEDPGLVGEKPDSE
jgi:hypothetical protein